MLLRTAFSLLLTARAFALSAVARLPSPSSVALSDAAKQRGRRAIDFIDASPTPYHCAETVRQQLEAAGFQELRETEPWSVVPGGKYYLARHEGTIVAVAIGGAAKPETTAFKLLGAHTDTPALKVRPVGRRGDAAAKNTSAALGQVGVECYGGGLWHTWLDRDLGVAGRVVLRDGDGFQQKLVRVDQPICRIPSLCIHLQTAAERDSLALNKEDHLQPVLCSTVAAAMAGDEAAPLDSAEESAWAKKHPAKLLEVLAAELDVPVEAIADFDLTLFDTQGGSLSGASGEFLTTARLDDQASCFVLTEALLAHCASDAFSGDEDVSVLALFDHEEVGSASAHGAGSPVLGDAIERVHRSLRKDAADGLSDGEALAVAMRRSILVSVDQAHAVHPNYMHKHDGAHAPRMNHGLVLKTNANQRYTTDAVTGFLLRETARRAGCPELQEFVVRNDCPCGSTIGPIMSTRFGVRAADVGLPQLSMHSIREMGGVHDLSLAFEYFTHLLRDFRELDDAFRKA